MIGNRYQIKYDSRGTAMSCEDEWRDEHTEYWAIRRTYYPTRDRIVQYVTDAELNLLNHRIVNLSYWLDKLQDGSLRYSVLTKLQDLEVIRFNQIKYQTEKGGE
ncbi:MAG: hypothetical protein CMF49_03640 [Legionellales bacterium]|jgi:hypothetical protein|nr:hypothetical protein [Legionellales bacterium]